MSEIPPGMTPTATIRGPADLRRITGHMGELVVREALGAQRWTSSAYTVPPQVATHPLDPKSAYDINPDLWWPEQTALVEVKAGIKGRRYYVTKRQLDSYAWIRVHGRAPIPSPRVFYAFVCFEHPYADRRKGSARPRVADVVKHLRQHIWHVVVADLTLVLQWSRTFGHTDHDWITPLSPKLGAWENYYRITPTRLDRVCTTDPCAGLPDAIRRRVQHTHDGKVRRLVIDRPPRVWHGPPPQAPRWLFGDE